jgi:exodeoxyribonuclease-3
MKIISWNVNGIRAILKKDYFIDLINSEDPDVFCMGETKISCPFLNVQEEITKKLKSKYFHYWSPCKTRKGYSGTAIYTKKEPENVIYGLKIGDTEHDDEGRVITCEFKKYYLIHVYTPNSGQELARLEWRTETWDRMFGKFIEKLQKNKPVIVCGDLNVAHKEIDLKNPKTNLRTAGYTIEERTSFDKLLKDTELVDTFRNLNPELIKYSYWSYKFQARLKNAGWRIDYFLVDRKIFKKVIKSDILDNILGSDHAPIILEIKIKN